MTYRPREFWEQRLSEQFDLRGTGETSMSAAYNDACYVLRREVLDRTLAEAGIDPRGKDVLDVGCGSGFWTNYYVSRGARYTGVDIAEASVQRLRERWPQANFLRADVGGDDVPGSYDVVNVFDVLYHITDDARWEAAVQRLGRALKPGGVLLVTDTFADTPGLQSHNKMRALARYRAALEATGLRFEWSELRPTHVLLNIHLGFWRFLNRAPGLLLALDRTLLALGAGRDEHHNRLVAIRRVG